MYRVGEFEKVSFGEFYSAMKDEFHESNIHEDEIRTLWNNIQLPIRSTSGSAGYDFKAPFAFQLEPGDTIRIPTGIRVKMENGWWLGCLPRSGMGFKYRLQLDNTVGVIDSDYYYSDNEGHIFAKITNDGKKCKTISINQGDGFLQGIFIPFGITYSDKASGIRNGGMGSTDHTQ